jgi:hypothetical protein
MHSYKMPADKAGAEPQKRHTLSSIPVVKTVSGIDWLSEDYQQIG